MISGYSNVKMKAEERHVNMCPETELWQEDKNCKTEAVSRRQGCRKRVRDGKKRWKNVRREDVTLLNTDALTHKHFYTPLLFQTPLRAEVFSRAFAHRRLYKRINEVIQRELNPENMQLYKK